MISGDVNFRDSSITAINWINIFPVGWDCNAVRPQTDRNSAYYRIIRRIDFNYGVSAQARYPQIATSIANCQPIWVVSHGDGFCNNSRGSTYFIKKLGIPIGKVEKLSISCFIKTLVRTGPREWVRRFDSAICHTNQTNCSRSAIDDKCCLTVFREMRARSAPGIAHRNIRDHITNGTVSWLTAWRQDVHGEVSGCRTWGILRIYRIGGSGGDRGWLPRNHSWQWIEAQTRGKSRANWILCNLASGGIYPWTVKRESDSGNKCTGRERDGGWIKNRKLNSQSS